MDIRSGSSQLSPVDAAASSIKESIAAVLRWSKLTTAERDDDVENVHQLRIAIRRSTAAIELFEDFLPAGCRNKLLNQLKKLRKAAGPLRDKDVLAERVTAEAFGIAMYSLSSHLAKQRAAARSDLKKLYEKSGRGEKLEQLTTEAVCAIRPRRKQSKRPNESYSSFARHRLRETRRELSRSLKAKFKQTEQMHEFRVGVKALRYRLELLKPAFATDRYDKVYRLVKKISQRLGEVNDHAMVERMFNEWQKELPQPATVKLLKRASAQEHESLCKSLQDFSKWWTQERRQRLRRQVKKLIATASERTLTANKLTVAPRSRPAK
jgi:CHAD domain-containing protein